MRSATTTFSEVLRAQARTLDALADVLARNAIASDVLDVRAAAKIANCSARTLRTKIKEGKLDARGEGRLTVIDRTELDRFLRELPPCRVRERHAANGVEVAITDDADRRRPRRPAARGSCRMSAATLATSNSNSRSARRALTVRATTMSRTSCDESIASSIRSITGVHSC